MAAELVAYSLAVDARAATDIPVGHREGTQLALETVIEALRPPMTNPKYPKYAHNATTT